MKFVFFDRCWVCGSLNCWKLSYSRRSDGEIYRTLPSRLVPRSVQRIKAVELKRKPRKGKYFEVRPNGSIPGIADAPCDRWRRIIKRRYKSGTRFIRFAAIKIKEQDK